MATSGLKGRVVLVTGANHGIGAATAQAFAAEGASVFVHYLRLADEVPASEAAEPAADAPGPALYAAERARDAEAVVEAIRRQGGQAAMGEFDLSEPRNIPRLFDRVEAALGPVEVLVNNAADWEGDTFIPQEHLPIPAPERSAPSHTINARLHDRHFAVNSRAVALMMAEYLRCHLARQARWGRIVNVSTDGAHCFPGEISYGASKAALEAWSRSAAAEMGCYGITVNIVSPGPIQTGYITPEMEAAILPAIPLGRLGQPDDVADTIVFLASEQARWLTGQTLYVGGGHTM